VQAPEASDAASEDSDEAVDDTACGGAPANASPDKERARLAKGQIFVEPDDPRELEQDVKWMDTPRQQTESDPHTRATLLQLLELAGGGVKAFKGVDAGLADLIKVRAVCPLCASSLLQAIISRAESTHIPLLYLYYHPNNNEIMHPV
jgi:hypothetical protein